MIIITGIGRSGTSLIAEFFRQMGFDIGTVSWNKNTIAGNEDVDTLLINKQILKGKIPKTDIINLKRDVVKDPLFVSDRSIIRAWCALRKDIRVIYMHRDFEAIAASQKRHPNMYTPAYRCFPDLMEIKEREFLKELHKLNVPHAVLSFPNLNPEDIIHAIKHIHPPMAQSIDWSKGLKVWLNLLDQNKIHIK